MHIDYFVHYCPSAKVWRTVHIDNQFISSYKSGDYPIEEKNVRGNIEHYVVVPADSEFVKPLDQLIKQVACSVYAAEPASDEAVCIESDRKPYSRREHIGLMQNGKSEMISKSAHLDDFMRKIDNLYPSWQTLNQYFVEVMGLRRIVRKSYIGYQKKSSSKMFVSITPKPKAFLIRITSTLDCIDDPNKICAPIEDERFVISYSSKSRLEDVFKVLDQLQV